MPSTWVDHEKTAAGKKAREESWKRAKSIVRDQGKDPDENYPLVMSIAVKINKNSSHKKYNTDAKKKKTSNEGFEYEEDELEVIQLHKEDGHISLEEVAELESEIDALMMEAASAESELVSLECELMNYETARTVVAESFDNEYKKNFAFEGINDEEDGIFARIIAALKKFAEKIKELWEKIINWIKATYFEKEWDWYWKYKGKIQNGIPLATEQNLVKIHSYAIDNPAEAVITDVKAIDTNLKTFYSEAKDLCKAFMNPDQNKSIIQKLKEKFGQGSIQHQMVMTLKEQWGVLKEACHIQDMQGTFTTTNVKETILQKYFGGKGQSTKEEVPAIYFAKNIQTIDNVFNKENTLLIQKTCELIRQGSTELDMLLSDLDKYIKGGLHKFDKDLDFDLKEGKLGAISIIRGTLSICNTIGQTYWKIYLDIRNDIKRCCRVYISTAKTKK
jgi:hypothetical protein